MEPGAPDATPFREPAFATGPLRMEGRLEDGRPASLTVDGERLVWDVPKRAVHAGERVEGPLAEVSAVLVTRRRTGVTTTFGATLAGFAALLAFGSPAGPADVKLLACVAGAAAALILPWVIWPRSVLRVDAGARSLVLVGGARLHAQAAELAARVRRVSPDVVTALPPGLGAFLSGELRALVASRVTLAAQYDQAAGASATDEGRSRYVTRRRGLAAWTVACWLALPSLAALRSAWDARGALDATVVAAVTYVCVLVACLVVQAVLLRLLRGRAAP